MLRRSSLGLALGLAVTMASSSPALAQAPSIGGPSNILSGTLTGTYTLGGTGNLNVSQTTDLATAPANMRLNMSNTTLSPSVSTGNVWENFSSFVTLNGPGAVTAEINLFHSDLTVASGGSITGSGFAENYEAKFTNSGAVSHFQNFLGLTFNLAGGTITSDNWGAKFQLSNANASAGSVAAYAAIDMEAEIGGGSVPTNYYLIRNNEPNASLNTMGNIAIGTLSPQSSNKLFVLGSDTSSGTFPVVVKNSTPANILLLGDDGSMTVGLSGGSSGFTSNGSINISSGSVYKVNGTVGATKTCTVNQALTLIFTAGILTGGTCAS